MIALALVSAPALLAVFSECAYRLKSAERLLIRGAAFLGCARVSGVGLCSLVSPFASAGLRDMFGGGT